MGSERVSYCSSRCRDVAVSFSGLFSAALCRTCRRGSGGGGDRGELRIPVWPAPARGCRVSRLMREGVMVSDRSSSDVYARPKPTSSSSSSSSPPQSSLAVPGLLPRPKLSSTSTSTSTSTARTGRKNNNDESLVSRGFGLSSSPRTYVAGSAYTARRLHSSMKQFNRVC